MKFEVLSLSVENAIERRWLEAQDEADARRQASELALTVLRIRRSRASEFSGFSSSSRFSLVLFSQELLALLNAGLSLVECIDAICEKNESPASRNVVARIGQALREGSKLSTALGLHPQVFPALYVGLVEAAEGTSDLPKTLTRYIDYQARVDGVRSKLASAAIYPLILLIAGGGVTVFLMGFVVPRFAAVFKDTGRELSGLSRIMLETGEFVAANALAMGATFAVGLTILGWTLIRSYRRGSLQRLFIRLPGIGRYLRLYELSRLYLTLGMLIEGGIPLVRALQTSARVTSISTRGHLLAACKKIESGSPLSHAFEQHSLTTGVSLRMLRAGERSGEVGTMLTRAAIFYDGDIGRFIDRFTKAFEPTLMMVIGAIVGLIVVMLYMPIFDLAGSLQ